MTELNGKLRQVNGRLKASKVGVAVEQNGDRLCLRATLPPKPDSERTEPYQQRIYLKLPTSPAGLKQAEKEARLLGAQLATREFSWSDWGCNPSGNSWTCSAAIDGLREKYLADGGSEDTWGGDYWKALKKLSSEAKLRFRHNLSLTIYPSQSNGGGYRSADSAEDPGDSHRGLQSGTH